MLLDERSVYSGDPREAHQLPAGLVAVPAVYRVGEKTLDGVGEQHIEEKLRAHLLKLDLASVKALQHLVLLRAGERVEGLAVGFAAIVVRIADPGAVDRRGRQRRLVALLRRPLGPRALRVLLRHRSVTAEELLVDEGGDPGLLRARSQLVLRDEVRHRGVEESDLGLRQEHIGTLLRRGCGRAHVLRMLLVVVGVGRRLGLCSGSRGNRRTERGG